MVGHGQLTVEQNAKIVNVVCELYCGVRQSQRLCRDLTTAGVFLRLLLVELQTIVDLPVADQSDVVDATDRRRSDVRRPTSDKSIA